MTARVVVVGLGPAGPDLVTAAATAAIERIEFRFIRTSRHPAATLLDGAHSFDEIYDTASSLDEVYAAIVNALVAAAAAHGEVLYAVPGSPAVAERTVELLRERAEIDVEVLAALSFLDLAWARLGIDPVAAGVRVIDGHRFAAEAAGERGPLLVAQCDRRDVLSAIKLAVDDPPESAVLLCRLGLEDEVIREVDWADLDRTLDPDHLTSVYIAEMGSPVAAELVRFGELVRTLREQCPWDREQTHQSLRRYVIEETYEVVDAIEGLGPDGEGVEHLEEELGDLLFQVFFHATIAEQAGWFDLADVARGIHDKLHRRHPHVFGGAPATDVEGLRVSWEAAKRVEKGRASAMDGIPAALPALLQAAKVGKRAASVGFDWREVPPVYDKIDEELAELRSEPSEDELGDVLFSVVNLARHLGIDPESALRGSTAKFKERFVHVEAAATEQGIDLAGASIAELDRLWESAKGAVR
ncbi:MAG: nucleoside triphosphate pyrophosphohydrolase [Acidimicrobiales bacterium]